MPSGGARVCLMGVWREWKQPPHIAAALHRYQDHEVGAVVGESRIAHVPLMNPRRPPAEEDFISSENPAPEW